MRKQIGQRQNAPFQGERIAVTGAGIVSALGQSVPAVWDALLAGAHGIDRIVGFDPGGFDCQQAAQAPDLNPQELGIHSKDARIMDKLAHMLIKCGLDAIRESGLHETSLPREEIGMFVGIGMVDYEVKDLLPAVLKSIDAEDRIDYDAFYSAGYQEIYPLWPLSMLNNITCCLAAIHLDIRGENAVFSPDADAGAEAIAEGGKTLLAEKARAVIVGGVSEKVSPMSLARAHLNHILNTTDQAKEKRCRPFSKHRKGTILGEGCGIMVLEPYSSAIERGISPMALISGYGSACEVDESGPGPTPGSIAYAMKEAVRNAELAPADIDVIIAHGDGTYSGDKNEIEAIHGVFATVVDRINVYSSKGALGNLLSGSPAVDAVLAVRMLQSGIIPPTIHCAPKESHIRFNIVQKRPLQAYPKRILINSQSYQGRCASLVLESCSN
ncbi:MAG: hypothetical protein JSU59_02110 [Nitrospirota bacterium]|nr:MAG: hypothetical protein JSU59_02110 [Nitrospirota bacterium]